MPSSCTAGHLLGACPALPAVPVQLGRIAPSFMPASLLLCVPHVQVEQPRPLDLTPESASMLEKLMLAQAQVGWGGSVVGAGCLGGFGTRS